MTESTLVSSEVDSSLPVTRGASATGAMEISERSAASERSVTAVDNDTNNHNSIHRSITTTTDYGSDNHRISAWDACMHLIKGNLGPGCLNIPHAFVLSGWLMGLGLFVIVVIQGIYSMYILVYCKNLLLRAETPCNTFMDVAHAAYGTAGSAVIQLFLVVLQIGVCCVFLSLLATNLQASLQELLGNSSNSASSNISQEWCVLLISVLLLGVVLFQNLKELRWLSATANVFMVTAIFTATIASIVVILQPDYDDHDRPPPSRSTSSISNIATFVSSMFFSFEGIGLVLPIENSYVGPRGQRTADGDDGNLSYSRREVIFQRSILIGSMSIVASLFLCIGIASSLAFTDISSGSITAYLTQQYPKNLWFQIVNSLVMVAVFMTFPLQLTPAMEVLEQWFGPGCDPQCYGCERMTSPCHGLLLVRRRQRRQRRTHIRILQQEEVHEPLENDRDGLLRQLAPKQHERRGQHQAIESSNSNLPSPGTFLQAVYTDNAYDDSNTETEQQTLSMTEDQNNDAAATSSSPNVALITNNDQDEEVIITTTPILENTCFGEREWIFRRYMVVFVCAFVVLVVNDLALLMSLFGAVGQTGLALMPCAIHLRLQQQGIAPSHPLLSVVDVCTIAFSFTVMVTGVVFSIQEIISKKQGDNDDKY